MSHTIIIFGATGDLAREKLFPSLMKLFHNNELPEGTKVIGFSRREWSDKEFQDHLEPYLAKMDSVEKVSAFLKTISYHQGNFDDIESYNKLYTKIKGPTLLFLSISPDNFATVVATLKKTTLKDIFKNKDSKMLIEKPFGLDHASAEALDKSLCGMCTEEQIYRVDHYLAKPAVMELLTKEYESKNLARIHMRLFESKDIGTRGASYDKVGALIDVAQNHMLETLATLIMKKPVDTNNPEIVRKARTEALQSLVTIDMVRGQYQGYREHVGVEKGSETETYFKLLFQSHIPELSGVDIVLESGKAWVESVVDIQLVYRNKSVKTIQIQPAPEQGRHAYEKLFFDALSNNDELFPSIEEILAAWYLIDEAKRIGITSPLINYSKGASHI